jgi:ankyrin repeat protein
MRDSALAASSILRHTLTLVGVTIIATLSCAQQNSIAAQKASSGLNRDEALAKLRALGVEFNEPSFLRSVDQENPALVNLFLVAGVDPNSNEMGGSTALMIAAGLHRIGTGGCVDGIIHACYSTAKKTDKSDLDIVHLLINGGAVVQTRDGDGETALHKAAAGGNVEAPT